MWKWIKDKHKNKVQHNINDVTIEVDLETVKNAVRDFAKEAPEGVTTKILVKDDHSIDFGLLKSYLKGVPDKTFYMSKETYEIFEEQDKDIPIYLDSVQYAVDRYVDMYDKLPIIPGDPYYKISYLLLENSGLLHERPTIDLYITDDEYLITHKKPT